MEVSWQVTGIRQDAYANKHRSPVEEIKPEEERGYYLNPDAFDQPKEKGILYKQLKENLEKQQQELPQPLKNSEKVRNSRGNNN